MSLFCHHWTAHHALGGAGLFNQAAMKVEILSPVKFSDSTESLLVHKMNIEPPTLLLSRLSVLHGDTRSTRIANKNIKGTPLSLSNFAIIPHICHERHEYTRVNFYRFNAKNWHFRQILCEKVAFSTDLTRKIGVFRCKFYSPKILTV